MKDNVWKEKDVQYFIDPHASCDPRNNNIGSQEKLSPIEDLERQVAAQVWTN